MLYFRLMIIAVGLFAGTPAYSNENMSKRIVELMNVPENCGVVRNQMENFLEYVPPIVFRKHEKENLAYLILRWHPMEKESKGLADLARLVEAEEVPNHCQRFRMIWNLDTDDLSVGVYDLCPGENEESIHKASGYFAEKDHINPNGKDNHDFWLQQVDRVVSEAEKTLSRCKE